MTETPRACIIKCITAVIYGFRNKLEHFSLNTRLGWKGLPQTYLQAYYGNPKITTVISFITETPRVCIIKHITTVIYGFRNKLEH